MNSPTNTQLSQTTNRSSTMCRRLVTTCLTCKYRVMNLMACRDWKSTTSKNMFGSGWMKQHVDDDVGNLINMLKLTFCKVCVGTKVIEDRRTFEMSNKKLIDNVVAEIEKSLIGVTQVRVQFPGYRVFV